MATKGMSYGLRRTSTKRAARLPSPGTHLSSSNLGASNQLRSIFGDLGFGGVLEWFPTGGSNPQITRGIRAKKTSWPLFEGKWSSQASHCSLPGWPKKSGQTRLVVCH